MNPSLFVTLRARPEVDAALAEQLPRGTWEYPEIPLRQTSRPGIRALLVGDMERELPGWDPSDFPSLRFVQCVYAGVDHLPISRLPPEVRVAGNPGGYSEPVAEHAVALAFAAAKRLRSGQTQTERGELRPAQSGRLLLGARAVILGVGGIGRAVGRRLRALGMRVDGVNRGGTPIRGFHRVFSVRNRLEALEGADLVVNCLPLSRATSGMVGRKEFGSLAPGAIYVNVGRAQTTDPLALESWLRGDPRNAAGIDVWWGEEFATGRVSPPFSIAELPNLVATPHSAALVDGAREVALVCAIRNVARFLEGRLPKGVVDRGDYPTPDAISEPARPPTDGRLRRGRAPSAGVGLRRSRRARTAL